MSSFHWHNRLVSHIDSSTPGMDTLHGSILPRETSTSETLGTISSSIGVTTPTSSVSGKQLDTGPWQISVSQSPTLPSSQNGVLHDTSQTVTLSGTNPSLVPTVDPSVLAKLEQSSARESRVISNSMGTSTTSRVILADMPTSSSSTNTPTATSESSNSSVTSNGKVTPHSSEYQLASSRVNN